ncbi:carotenoid oxygenase family protein [Sinosporangium siamense]|uniref:Dioxygenase n=1 Tax=Sinosporangium siamense TaxID=1367973 RepID=A0A919RDN7_9ACTN|nr:carotenoid oxygenase family protein [Sinosporangium siamense]GII90524.1 retinal pigment epithelial membrane protein [Sinosporangium siamense]
MSETSPFYLQGFLAPVADEVDYYDLPVTGALPYELNGCYARNGPNPLPGDDPGNWFLGAGMVHGVRLRAGKAEWYRNRWVRTNSFVEDAPYIRADYSIDLTAVPANTNVVACHGKAFALVEAGVPYEMTFGLDTVGPFDFGGRLKTAMTAHPKHDPVTEEMHFFGYGFRPPYLTYYRLSPEGELVESREIEVIGPTMMHDFAISSGHVVWMDLPVVFDVMTLSRTGMPYRWDDAYGARLGVMPMTEDAKVTWHDIDPCYIFHTANAYEDDSGRVVLNAIRYRPDAFKSVWTEIEGQYDPAASAAILGRAHLHRFVIDPANGVSEEQLDDLDIEFPTWNIDRTGDDNRYLYAVSVDGIVKYDHRNDSTEFYKVGRDQLPGEAVFVPSRHSRGEDEGWLISLVSGAEDTPSELLVLDARDLTFVASVQLPCRVPEGLHGSWLPYDEEQEAA